MDLLLAAVATAPWALFLPACFAINLAPGPNNMAALAHGARLGVGAATLGGLGRLAAFALLIAIAGAGLGAALMASATLFTAVKLAGAAYLVYIGWRIWRAPAARVEAGRGGVWEAARREFGIAIGNPKAIATFTAFFPQFIDPALSFAAQFAVLGVAFLAMEGLVVALYAAAGRLARGALGRPERLRLLNRGVGGFLMLSGGAMAAGSR